MTETISTPMIDHPYPTDDARWEAIITKDANAIGHVWIAVRTTGVYCRPGCPAKQPLRRNVHFFPTPIDAENAGYRACKRCMSQRQ